MQFVEFCARELLFASPLQLYSISFATAYRTVNKLLPSLCHVMVKCFGCYVLQRIYRVQKKINSSLT